jgi:hypothetical protein
MQIEALARRAAAAGVAILTLSWFAVGENALAGVCSDTAASRPRTFRKASVDDHSSGAR